jgi:hypothetical protein
MKIETEKQRFVAKLNEISLDEKLPETVNRHSSELIREMKRLVNGEGEDEDLLLDCIEYGMVEHEYPWGKEQTFGLKIRGRNELLSDLMHAFENIITYELPDSFNHYEPEVSHEEWKAVIRMTIDVITALDRRVVKDNGNMS